MYSALLYRHFKHFLAAFILIGLMACAAPTPLVVFSGNTMGTTYSVKVFAKDSELKDLKITTEEVLTRVNQLMSTYLPDSEISTFNKSKDLDWHTVSSETIKVLQAAQHITSASKGAFDITVGPLVNLWGFGPELQPDTIPPADVITKTKAFTGMNLLTINASRSAIKKNNINMQIDLSAIAKGYGVDAVSQMLTAKGMLNHLVEIGGEIIASGTKSDGVPWNVALEKPESQGRKINRILHLENMAVASSGSYRNYFEKDGLRYSHTISPKTGRPITHKLISVSVLSANCMTADAWATALMVLGPEAGFTIAEQNNLAALLITKNENSFTERTTSRWNLLLP